jgi:hypothetical protein
MPRLVVVAAVLVVLVADGAKMPDARVERERERAERRGAACAELQLRGGIGGGGSGRRWSRRTWPR